MTFDEAIKKAKKNLVYDDNTWGVWTELLEDLQQEYAPTIEMTKFENDILSKYKFGDNGDFFDLVEYETDYLYRELSASELMQAWLHPETIKIVDE